MSAAIEQRNQDATAYVGNLDEKVSEELLWELMIQAGPIVSNTIHATLPGSTGWNTIKIATLPVTKIKKMTDLR